MLKASPDAIIAMDSEGCFVEFNPAAEKIFGYTREEVLGKPLVDFIIPMRLREKHKQGLARYLATGEGPVLNRPIELPGLRADGTEFPAEIAIVSIAGRDPPLFTAFLRDISARKAAQLLVDSHRQALQLLAESAPLDDVLEFLAGVVERHSGDGMLAAITPLNEAGTHFQRGIGPSLPDAFNAAIEGVPVDSPTGLCAAAVRRREAVAVHDFNADPAWQAFGKSVASFGLRSGQSIPIVSFSGQTLGTFSNYYRHAGDPAPQHRELVDMAVRTAAIAIERKWIEARQRLLTNELAHRSKNLLAVVQAMVLRSLSGTRSVSEASEVLMQRIQALAQSQSALVNMGFTGASVVEIVRLELEIISDRVETNGPDVTLNPRAAQTFALILHELATNAAKYGALSRPEGRVAVQWSVAGRGEPRFRFQWQERGGPPVAAPARQGFGRMLIEKAATQDFGVPPKISFAPEGLVYEIEAPLSVVGIGRP